MFSFQAMIDRVAVDFAMMIDRRPLLRSIFDAAVARAHPDRRAGAASAAAAGGRIICLAAGKGAAALAAAAERHYLDTLGLPPASDGAHNDPTRPRPSRPTDRGHRSRTPGAG